MLELSEEDVNLFHLRVKLQTIACARKMVYETRINRHLEFCGENIFDVVVLKDELLEEIFRLAGEVRYCNYSDAAHQLYLQRTFGSGERKAAVITETECKGGCLPLGTAGMIYMAIYDTGGFRENSEYKPIECMTSGFGSNSSNIIHLEFMDQDHDIIANWMHDNDFSIKHDCLKECIGYGNGEFIKPDIYHVLRTDIDEPYCQKTKITFGRLMTCERCNELLFFSFVKPYLLGNKFRQIVKGLVKK